MPIKLFCGTIDSLDTAKFQFYLQNKTRGIAIVTYDFNSLFIEKPYDSFFMGTIFSKHKKAIIFGLLYQLTVRRTTMKS